jgi:hypothetical protein
VRDHPLMSYHGQRNWPPAWLWRGKGKNKYPQGEVGRLKKVTIAIADSDQSDGRRAYHRIFLYMEYLGARYIGCLLFDDAAACLQIGEILSKHRGRNLQTIGDLDLSHLL